MNFYIWNTAEIQSCLQSKARFLTLVPNGNLIDMYMSESISYVLCDITITKSQ